MKAFGELNDFRFYFLEAFFLLTVKVIDPDLKLSRECQTFINHMLFFEHLKVLTLISDQFNIASMGFITFVVTNGRHDLLQSI